MEDYLHASGDKAFVRESWTFRTQSIRMVRWHGRRRRRSDGQYEAGLGALEYGALTDVQSDIYTSAVWVRATRRCRGSPVPVGDGESPPGAAHPQCARDIPVEILG